MRRRGWTISLAWALAALAGPAMAAQPARLTPKSQWKSAPSPDDYARVLSSEAKASSSNGLADLQCNAAEDGSLSGCKVSSEFPEKLRLGQSALQLAPMIRVAPPSDGGRTAGPVVIPVFFAIHPGAPSIIQNPNWAWIPSADQLRSWQHLSLSQQQRPWRVVVSCVVNAEGHMESCAVAGETPPGLGYGEAALRAAAHLQMLPRLLDGEPTGGAKVTIPFAGAGRP